MAVDERREVAVCVCLPKAFNHVISISQTYVQRGHRQSKGVWSISICLYRSLTASSTTVVVGFSAGVLRGRASNLGCEVADLLVKT